MEKSGKGLLERSQQDKVSQQTRFPVNDLSSNTIKTISGETVNLYYYNDTVLTADAGQAAGTIVVAKLNNGNIKTAIGDVIGHNEDTSFSWTTGTILTRRVDFPHLTAETFSRAPGREKATFITKNFSNGDYCIDHEYGIIYGKKATAGTSDTATYKVEMSLSGGGGGVASNVNIEKIGGTNAIVQNSAFGTVTPGIAIFGKYDATPDTYDDGDAVPIKMDSQGAVYVKDATAGTDVIVVNATGAIAINTTTAIAAEFKLLKMTVHFSAAPTTSQNIQLKLDSVAGVAYDTVLYSLNPSLSAATDVVFLPDGEMKFKTGDELVVTFTNTDTVTYGLSIYYQLI